MLIRIGSDQGHPEHHVGFAENGWKAERLRYTRIASCIKRGAKCDAKAYGKPRSPANCALNRLEPSNQIGTLVPVPGMAITR